MTVYDGDGRPDKYGKHPLRFKGHKSLEEVNDWLFRNYNGYHFVIILDQTKDEYEPLGKELLVYFSDLVLDEIAAYSGYKVVERSSSI